MSGKQSTSPMLFLLAECFSIQVGEVRCDRVYVSRDVKEGAPFYVPLLSVDRDTDGSWRFIFFFVGRSCKKVAK